MAENPNANASDASRPPNAPDAPGTPSSPTPPAVASVQKIPEGAVEGGRVGEPKPGSVLPSQIPSPDPNANPIPPTVPELLPPPPRPRAGDPAPAPPPPSPPQHHHDYSQCSAEERRRLVDEGHLPSLAHARPLTDEERGREIAGGVKPEDRERFVKLGREAREKDEAERRRKAGEKAGEKAGRRDEAKATQEKG